MGDIATGAAAPRLSAPEAIDDRHDGTTFDCGETALDDWLRHRARKSEGRFARTYVVCDGARIAAYVCISVGSVERTSAPKKLQRNAPDPIPVAIIGRLAVDRTYAGHGLGADLLGDALRRILGVAQVIGIRAVVIQAKTENAKCFYLKQAEFLEYPDESRTLFLPLDTVAQALP